MDTKTYKTGEVAKLAGITIRTLRYYDAIDLLKPSRILSNGHRQYDMQDIEKLQLILGLKLLDFSLDEIKAYLKNPEINLMDVLTYQKDLLTRKIDSYQNISQQIDFIVEHYKEASADSTTEVFSLYEMMQMVNHNEVLRKYFPEETNAIYKSTDAHGTHDALDKALGLLSGKNMKSISSDDRTFIIETFRKFICDYFYEVTKETIEKTTRMLFEISANDTSQRININESDLLDLLYANLLD